MSRFSQIFETFVLFLVNVFLWILIIVIYTILLLILFSIRFVIIYFVRKKHPQLTPLSPNDILLIREDLDKQGVVNGGIILKVKGHLDFKLLQKHFIQLFLHDSSKVEYENLYCDIVKRCGFLFKRRLSNQNWMRSSNFVHKEVRDFSTVKNDLSSWFQTKLVERVPLWQVIIITSNISAQECWVAMKGHHGLLDGYSFVHILNKLCGIQDKSKPPEILSFWKEMKLLFSLPLVTLRYLLVHFWFPDNFPPLPKLTQVEMLPMALASVDLQTLKWIRKKLNVHFLSLIYSLQIGALRRALLDKELPVHFSGKEELSRVTLLSTSFPVRNHPRNRLINHWSGGTIKIPLAEDCAVQRVQETDISFRQITGDEGPYLVWKYVSYLPWLFPASLNYKMSFSNLSLFRYRTSMSCIPQEEQEYFLLGHPVLNAFHAPVMKDCFPQAVMLGCSSTINNQVDFSLFGHPNLFPDQNCMDRLMEIHFKAELQQLLQECGAAPDVLLNVRQI